MWHEDKGAPVPGGEAPVAASDGATSATIIHPRRADVQAPPPRASHPPAYRGVVAGWPEDWRERWGRRANELEEGGLTWRDAESQAFVEIWTQVRRGRHDGTLAAAGPDPERN